MRQDAKFISVRLDAKFFRGTGCKVHICEAGCEVHTVRQDAKFFLTYVCNRTMILRTISYINSCKTVDRKNMNFPAGRHSKKTERAHDEYFTFRPLYLQKTPAVHVSVCRHDDFNVHLRCCGRCFRLELCGFRGLRLHQYHYAVSHDPRCHRLYDRHRRQCTGGSDLRNRE